MGSMACQYFDQHGFLYVFHFYSVKMFYALWTGILPVISGMNALLIPKRYTVTECLLYLHRLRLRVIVCHGGVVGKGCCRPRRLAGLLRHHRVICHIAQ